MELRYEQVCKKFGGVDALIDLNLQAPDGCFLAMLGPSGCGKTTALRLLAGLEEPTSGRMFIGPREVTQLPPRDRDIAMVFQSYALYPHKTVLENIDYPLRIRGRKLARAARREQIDKVAKLLNIGAYLDRYPRQLSGGQRQRVALARAIVRQPQAFLMDEPLSNLDAQLRFQMRAEIKRLQKELGVTTVYVTHDQLEAMTMADLIAVMSNGRLQQLASPAELYARPANLFVASFCGSPPMNLLDGTVGNGQFRREEGTFPVPDGSGAAGERVFGFRPEHAQITMRGAQDSLAGEVYVVEPLGSETLVSVKVGADRVNVRVPADFKGQIGDECGVRPDASRTVLFDKESGQLIQGSTAGASRQPAKNTIRESA
jgi:multiple sugar transport system ATP-binding protein